MFTNSTATDFLTLLITIFVLIIAYWKWSFQYWKRRNLPYLQPEIPYGNLGGTLTGREHIGKNYQRLYQEMKSRGWKHGGIYTFTQPSYFVLDLDYARNIMTKDFSYFADRNLYYREKDPLQAHLLNLTGKMKMMFQVMADCENDLQRRMQQECLKNEPINIREILACFTTNIIGTCAFGLDCKALEDENSPIRMIGRKMVEFSRWRSFKRTFANTFPKLAKFLDISLVGKSSALIMNMVQKNIDYREKNNVIRKDFLQLLVDLKNKAPGDSGDHDGKPLTMDEVASQCVVFFGAGFETSSTLMTFALYELAKNQEIQEKLRTEIRTVLEKHGDQMTYDSVQDIKYLSQVVDETLRMHPPGAQIRRKCVKDYKVPDEDVIIERGTEVTISTLGIHYDPEIYPDPLKFDPDRFSDENKRSRHNFAYLPFGEGPRNCIGMRFGLLQSKVGLVSLLKNYKFTLNAKTEQPLKYQPSNVVLAAQGEIWLNSEKI